jgi:hypothetical protein
VAAATRWLLVAGDILGSFEETATGAAAGSAVTVCSPTCRINGDLICAPSVSTGDVSGELRHHAVEMVRGWVAPSTVSGWSQRFADHRQRLFEAGEGGLFELCGESPFDVADDLV